MILFTEWFETIADRSINQSIKLKHEIERGTTNTLNWNTSNGSQTPDVPLQNYKLVC